MNPRRLLASAASLLALSVSVLGVTAGTASAATHNQGGNSATLNANRLPTLANAPADTDPQASCAARALCLWQNAGYKGIRWTYTLTTYGFDTYNYVGDAANDQTSALFNNRSDASLIFKNYSATNPGELPGDCVISEGAISNLAQDQWSDGSAMNDSISAFDLTSSGSC